MNRERLTTVKVAFAVVESYLLKSLSIKKTLGLAVETKGQQGCLKDSLLTSTPTFACIQTSANLVHPTFTKTYTTQNAFAIYFSMLLPVHNTTNNLN